MHAGGMSMGHRLVSAHLSNPDGHFEDIDIVGINDRLLAEAGTDWRFHDETPLPRAETSFSALQRYVVARDASHGRAGWGVKDPRISLFLPVWNRLLDSRGRFILVIRHWGGSIQSLFNRHSRVLVEQGMAAGRDRNDDHLSFWVRPGLAARMWIAYSRRLLEFARESQSATLVLPQPVLMNGFNLIEWMNDNWGTKLNLPPSGIVKPSLLTDQLDSAISDMITPMLRAQMESIWQELLEIAGMSLGFEPSAAIFQPHWVQRRPDPLLVRCVDRVQALALRVTAPIPEVLPDAPVLDDTWTIEDVRKQLQRPSSLPTTSLAKLEAWLEANAAEDAACWQDLGIRALRESAFDMAERAFFRAAATGRAAAALWLYLGQLYERTRAFDRAEYHYREAIRRNKRNTYFVVTLAKLLVVLYRNEEALELLEEHISASGHPALVVLWTQFMTELGRHDEAKVRVQTLQKQFPQHEAEWLRLLAILELPFNAQRARQSLNDVVRRGMNVEDLPLALAQILSHVDSSAAFRDLAERMIEHWRGIFSDDELRRVFVLNPA